MSGIRITLVCILTLLFAACGDDYNPCASGQYLCDNMCVDFETDDNHCGECDNACGMWSDCRRGVCECVVDHADCDGEQNTGCEVNFRENPDHCGSCDHSCETGQSCINGVCQ